MTAFVPPSDEKDVRRIVTAVQQLAQGRSNATGSVTLVANAATTAVPASNCAAGSVVLLSPLTANAAAEIGNGTIRVSSVSNGSFVLAHANNAQTDRAFGYVAIG